VWLVLGVDSRGGRGTPCGSGPHVLSPGTESFSCGGFDPHPWLYAGVTVALLAALAYAAARRIPAKP
jgi:hypothetical protein